VGKICRKGRIYNSRGGYHETSLMKFLLSAMPASASKMELKEVVTKSDETTASSV